jgi:hypothetical protein
VYVSGNGVVRRVDPDSGAVTTFASGFYTGGNRPTGVVFDTGVWGTSNLFVAQNGHLQGVMQVDSTGTASLFSGAGTLYSCNGIALPRPGGPFGNLGFVTNGAASFPSVSSVDAAGINATFLPGPGLSTIRGVAFAEPGSAFGTDLFIGDYSQLKILRTDAAGNLSTFVTLASRPLDLAFGKPGSPFGDYLYVTTLVPKSIVRIDPAGVVTNFATLMQYGGNTWDADLAFDPGGLRLYSSNGLTMACISFGPQVATYCTAKTNSCGSQPAIGWTGDPSATATSGFLVHAANTRGGKFGLMIYTDKGAGSAPFQGGTLCISATGIRRTVPVTDTMGTAGLCDGTLSTDVAAFAHGTLGGNPAAYLALPGTQVNFQYWGRDTVANGSLLSDALAIGVCP